MALLFSDAFSSAFYVLYLLAGFSDMIDGTVARKTGTESKFGERLDTAADMAFVAAAAFKMLPQMDIPGWIVIWAGIIAIIKILNIISAYTVHGEFVAVHSVANKVTGAMFFALPIIIRVVPLNYSSIIICLVASFAAVQEGHYIRTDHSVKKNVSENS
ncbi:MAG: CDP-alcohol phosphatidyltransferase family protein [Mogibacterium sp.]|nr:CDP-alcohol phosphatidyltransferase family protein [Mogibacterium sp.]